jgi:hypothetical protein
MLAVNVGFRFSFVTNDISFSTVMVVDTALVEREASLFLYSYRRLRGLYHVTTLKHCIVYGMFYCQQSVSNAHL